MFLLSLFVSFNVLADEDYSLDVTVTKLNTKPDWRVSYRFSHDVSQLDFSTTPYAFMNEHWGFPTSQGQFNYFNLKFSFNEAGAEFFIGVRGTDTRFNSGFFTSFVNFESGQDAVYLGHYLPRSVVVNGKNIAIDEFNIKYRLEDKTGGAVYYPNAEQNLDYRQALNYAFFGSFKIQKFEQFDLILSSKLPQWLRESYLQAAPRLMAYFTNSFKTELSAKPLIAIGFDEQEATQWSDGGAIKNQVLINVVGSKWQAFHPGSEAFLVSLLAHEMAHLWNAHHWDGYHVNPWLKEGSAELLSDFVLLQLGYITKSGFQNKLRDKQRQCEKDIRNAAIPDMHNVGMRNSIYGCGLVVLNSITNKLSLTPFELWHKLVNTSGGLGYDVFDLLKVIQPSQDREFVEQIELLITPNTLERQSALLQIAN